MPNLRLTDTEVTQLIGYIDDESRRIGTLRAGNDGAKPTGAGDHGHHGQHGHHATAAQPAEHKGH